MSSFLDSENMTDKNNSEAKISADEAKATALKDAGLKESDVNFLRSEKDYDDGVLKYEIEFTHNGIEYDYDIDANNGKILWKDKDNEHD